MTDESVMCRRCGTANRPGVSYCAKCGQRLVVADEATLARPGVAADSGPCPRCGALNRVGAAFCSECGFNIRSAMVAVAGSEPVAVAVPEATPVPGPISARAWLGPMVLLVAAAGLATAWVLPFAYGEGSLADQAFGPGGFGLAFWGAYPSDGGFLDAAYYGVFAPLPVLIALLAVLALIGFVRGSPGRVQRAGLAAAIAWCAALAILFVVIEVGSGLGGGLIELLRGLSPAGLIASMAAGIGIIGGFTRLAGG